MPRARWLVQMLLLEEEEAPGGSEVADPLVEDDRGGQRGQQHQRDKRVQEDHAQRLPAVRTHG